MPTPDLDKARETLGLSNTDLARMLGVSPERSRQTLSDWRTGRRQMDEARIRLLNAYLSGYRPPDWPTT